MVCDNAIYISVGSQYILVEVILYRQNTSAENPYTGAQKHNLCVFIYLFIYISIFEIPLNIE